MISFKNFLKRPEIHQKLDTKEQSLEEICEILNSPEFSLAKYHILNKPSVIYRGTQRKMSYYSIIDTSNSTRKSKSGTNVYTVLFDNNDFNKDYPKRSKSIICSFNETYASFYGYTNAIYPSNSAKIGIVPENDIWSCKIRIGGNLLTLNELTNYFMPLLADFYSKTIGQLFSRTDTYNILKNVSTKQEIFVILKNALQNLSKYNNSQLEEAVTSKIIKYKITLDIALPIIKFLISHQDNLENILDNVFNFDELGFANKTAEQLYSLSTGSETNECWVSGKSLCIKPDKLHEVRSYLLK